MKVKVVLHRRAEGGYVARVPTVPGLVSEGRDKREALRNMKRNILVYLDPANIDSKRNSASGVVAEVSI
jgi:predicted RNase H-like HicB family nuclease